MPVQSNVDGAKFAAFIDAAVADSIMELGKREDDLSKAGVTMLGNVDGKSMLEQMSPQFLAFVLGAYRSLKYRSLFVKYVSEIMILFSVVSGVSLLILLMSLSVIWNCIIRMYFLLSLSWSGFM